MNVPDRINFLNQNYANDTILIVEAIEIYIDTVKDLIIQLGQALESNDSEKIRHLTHQIKGASDSFGKNDVSLLIEECKENKLDFSKHYDELKSSLDQYLEDLSQITTQLKN